MFKNKKFKIKPIKINKRYFLLILLLLILAIIGGYFVYGNHESQTDESAKIEEINKEFYNNDKEKAIKELERYVNNCRDCNDAKKKLLSFYFQEKKFDKFVATISEDTESASTCNMRAYIALQDSDFKTAEDYYDKAIKLAPRSSNYYINFATYYVGVGKNDEARQVIENAKSRGVESSELYILSSSIALRTGDYSLAGLDADKALEIDPENTQALAIKKELDNL